MVPAVVNQITLNPDTANLALVHVHSLETATNQNPNTKVTLTLDDTNSVKLVTDSGVLRFSYTQPKHFCGDY